MTTKKPKTYPSITKALAHYEAALATLQQTLQKIDNTTARRIEEAYLNKLAPTVPGAFMFQLAIHDGGDAFRAAKQILDPDRVLPSTTPALPETQAAEVSR